RPASHPSSCACFSLHAPVAPPTPACPSSLAFSHRSAAPRDLHSFPTRRSSDLERPLESGGDIYIAGTHLNEAMHGDRVVVRIERSEEHTSDSSHEWISYAVFCLKKKRDSGMREDLQPADSLFNVPHRSALEARR